MLITRFVVGLSVGMLALCGGTYAQDYPTKPIRIYAGAAGGGGDFTGRLVAQGISPALGQPVIVENRANGVIAAEAVSKSPPDGYALALGGGSTPEQFGAFVKSDISKMAKVIKDAGIKPN